MAGLVHSLSTLAGLIRFANSELRQEAFRGQPEIGDRYEFRESDEQRTSSGTLRGD